MCLLIQQPAGCTFSKVELNDFIRRNPDGYGYARAERGHIIWGKMVADAETIIADYYRHMAGKSGMIHFRMATHGQTDEANAHPFEVTPEIVLAHNGILSSGNPFSDDESDTAHFVKYIVRPIALSTPDLLFTPEWGEMVGNLIGKSNKLTIQHADGRSAIINSSSGVLHKGAWMSNTYAWSNSTNAYAVQIPKTYAYDPSDTDWMYEDRRSATADLPSVYGDPYGDPLIDCAKYFESGGRNGIAQWVKANPQEAADTLIALYDIDEDYAAELVTGSENMVVDHLEEALRNQGLLVDLNQEEEFVDEDQLAFGNCETLYTH